MSNFRVGQKVVCVANDMFAGLLDEGRVYTVEAVVGPVLSYSIDGIGSRYALVLEEVENPCCDTGGFASLRFRPAVERGTEKGMSILRNLLNKAGKRVEVDA